MFNLYIIFQGLKGILDRLGHDHGTVLAAGAADGDDQAALAFGREAGNQKAQKPLQFGQEGPGLGRVQDEIADLAAFPFLARRSST